MRMEAGERVVSYLKVESVTASVTVANLSSYLVSGLSMPYDSMASANVILGTGPDT